MIPTLDEICKAAEITIGDVMGCYVYGSRVYGTATPDSDWDIMLITDKTIFEKEVESGRLNIHMMSTQSFERYLFDNDIKVIECFFAPEEFQIVPYKYEFWFKEPRLRVSVSATVSNSWVKCKKKLAQGDYDIGIKSLFHSLRLAIFGEQFADKKTIDFSSANWIWDELTSPIVTGKRLFIPMS